MEKLIEEFSFGLFFWQILLFLLLLLLLRKFAWTPILSAVEERETGIKDAMNAAIKAEQESRKLQQENDKILKQARIERDAILKEAREIKEKTVAEAKDIAKSEATKIIDSAKSVIQNEKLAALTEIKNQIGIVSIDIAQKVLGRELSESTKQDELVKEIIENTNLS